MATTPLEREILTHYSTTAGAYRGGVQNWTEIHTRIVRRFIDLGLLIPGGGPDPLQNVRPNVEALRVYLAALATVPLPVQRWVIEGVSDGDARDTVSDASGALGEAELAARLTALEHRVDALQGPAEAPRRERYDLEED